jgi:hypothetical protein
LAETFGMTWDELAAGLQEGKTLNELAEEKGVDLQALADEVTAQFAEKLDQAVADGELTQEQADEILARHEERMAEMLENGWGLMHHFGGFRARPFDRFNRGAMPGWDLPDDENVPFGRGGMRGRNRGRSGGRMWDYGQDGDDDALAPMMRWGSGGSL